MKKKQEEEEQIDDFQVETKFPVPGSHYNTSSNNPYAAPKKLPTKNFSPLSWEEYFDELFYLEDGTSVFRAGTEGIIFFCIHGAGHSALSFALLAKQIKKFGTLIAFDFRGHGFSKKAENLEDMSIETLKGDTIWVLKEIIKKYPEQNIITVGHSMGGSVCSRVTEEAQKEDYGRKIQGMFIIDVVEGTAMDALPFMTSILHNRPQVFDNLEQAIKWSVTSNTLKKVQSARVSIPPQLIEVTVNGNEKKFGWKVDLMKSEKYWKGWFVGLSASFLNVKIPKTLILAERERLDKQLMIAQMQGKFKLSILMDVGHSVQEDDYKGTAKLLHQFISLFRIPQTATEQATKNAVGLAKFHPDLKAYTGH